jgi:hypothetical protein
MSQAEEHQSNAREYRAEAAAFGETVKTSKSLRDGSRARQQQKAYTTFAEHEEWLAGTLDHLVTK